MMTFHPLADVLPLIEGDGFKELVADIKTNGLIDPIIMLDEQILDGRNRYRACIEAGVEPRFVPFDGGDPAAFVVGKNLFRRHLTTSQKAMAVARYATLSKGQNRPNEDAGIPASCKTVPEIAAMACINKETVSDARTVYANGTQEEIEAVINGKASVTTTAKTVRARRDGKPNHNPKNAGVKVRVPDGKTIIGVAREGLALEEGGMSPAAVADKVGLAFLTYKVARDVVLLSRRDDLNRKDRDTVDRAMRGIDVTRQVGEARRAIAPIASRVWGNRGGRMKKADERRAKQFDNAVEFLKHTCESAVDMVVPHISRQHADVAIRQLSDAEASLRKLKERIKGETQNG
jgi:hypothetical protein